MLRRDFLLASALGTAGALANHVTPAGMNETDPEPTAASDASTSGARATRKILIAGGGFNTAFIRYMAQLTGKTRPRICYLPTASADSAEGSLSFFRHCAPLDVQPFVQDSFIESLSQKQGWDEVLLSMDAIV